MFQKLLLVIGGPTASGKTALAIALARHYGTAILSADSRQFFREMAIGTARPDEEELTAAPHSFIADRNLEQGLSAGEYEREALTVLEELYCTLDVAVVVGGSGLYLKALTEGLDAFPPVPENIRQEVEGLYRDKGLTALQKAVAEADPAYFAIVDRQNPARLIRALCVCRTTGLPYSSFRQATTAERPFRPVYLTPYRPRAELYERIDRRVAQMMAAGLEDEARRLYPLRYLTPLRTVGYQELFDYFDGQYNLDRAVELIRRNSRHYAKRQLTWLRRDGYWKHIDAEDAEAAIDYIEHVRSHGLELGQSALEADESSMLYLRSSVAEQARLRYRVGRHSAALLEYVWENAESGFWLLHEVLRRAEGRPVQADVRPSDEALFVKAGFKSVDPPQTTEPGCQRMEGSASGGAGG